LGTIRRSEVPSEELVSFEYPLHALTADCSAREFPRARVVESRHRRCHRDKGKHRHPIIRKMKQHEYDGLVVLLIKNSVFSQIQSERQSIAVSS